MSLKVGFIYTVGRSLLVVIKLSYGAGQGAPIVFEAWTCPTATANLFSDSCSFIFDCARRLRWKGIKYIRFCHVLVCLHGH